MACIHVHCPRCQSVQIYRYRFTSMVRAIKAITDFAAVNTSACFTHPF
ncbi:IS1 family transposase [Yersinia ruckeri]|nr:hypothetical protein [Yersinia ruckeri]EKN4199768.1 hypothetical protein [Yersinia ruckeri]EKN4206388.1 hypothetical protein [Yersinia ruckeri]EKN4689754.1 hypothetical protein [Yersinia ruckeri]EKN4692363.1 hypothetical protein [Yersinia ruckeri]